MSDTRWIVVIPFKGAPDGKSRLAATVAHGASVGTGKNSSGFTVHQRERLALAFLQDTVAAVAQVRRVERILVISNASELADGAALRDAAYGDSAARAPSGKTHLGVSVIDDPGNGLNSAAIEGVAVARALDGRAWVAVLTGDLAYLRPADLEEALDDAESYPLGVVSDHEGIGSTMITMAPDVDALPRFGGRSREAHEAAGYATINLPKESSMRFDVDSVADLENATLHGRELGPASKLFLHNLGTGREPDTRAPLEGTTAVRPLKVRLHDKHFLPEI
jgi:2-phospho-L-lactate guanylyltransferase